MKTLRNALLATTVLLGHGTAAKAGEILITGWFEPGYATGYVNSDYDYTYGDTSGNKFGDLIDFNVAADYATPKVLTFDTPTYGQVTESFTSFDYIHYTAVGLFYELTGPTGWLDVNISYADAPPSFSFVDYGVTAPAPAPIVPPPSCNLVNCAPGNPPIDPPINVVGTPETSTWLMMLLGFAGLGFAARRRHQARHREATI